MTAPGRLHTIAVGFVALLVVLGVIRLTAAVRVRQAGEWPLPAAQLPGGAGAWCAVVLPVAGGVAASLLRRRHWLLPMLVLGAGGLWYAERAVAQETKLLAAQAEAFQQLPGLLSGCMQRGTACAPAAISPAAYGPFHPAASAAAGRFNEYLLATAAYLRDSERLAIGNEVVEARTLADPVQLRAARARVSSARRLVQQQQQRLEKLTPSLQATAHAGGLTAMRAAAFSTGIDTRFRAACRADSEHYAAYNELLQSIERLHSFVIARHAAGDLVAGALQYAGPDAARQHMALAMAVQARADAYATRAATVAAYRNSAAGG